jgi:hypothetical protein
VVVDPPDGERRAARGCAGGGREESLPCDWLGSGDADEERGCVGGDCQDCQDSWPCMRPGHGRSHVDGMFHVEREAGASMRQRWWRAERRGPHGKWRRRHRIRTCGGRCATGGPEPGRRAGRGGGLVSRSWGVNPLRGMAGVGEKRPLRMRRRLRAVPTLAWVLHCPVPCGTGATGSGRGLPTVTAEEGPGFSTSLSTRSPAGVSREPTGLRCRRRGARFPGRAAEAPPAVSQAGADGLPKMGPAHLR